MWSKLNPRSRESSPSPRRPSAHGADEAGTGPAAADDDNDDDDDEPHHEKKSVN